jgi:hypothetical protein
METAGLIHAPAVFITWSQRWLGDGRLQQDGYWRGNAENILNNPAGVEPQRSARN